jgi:hypothetical protein
VPLQRLGELVEELNQLGGGSVGQIERQAHQPGTNFAKA